MDGCHFSVKLYTLLVAVRIFPTLSATSSLAEASPQKRAEACLLRADPSEPSPGSPSPPKTSSQRGRSYNHVFGQTRSRKLTTWKGLGGQRSGTWRCSDSKMGRFDVLKPYIQSQQQENENGKGCLHENTLSGFQTAPLNFYFKRKRQTIRSMHILRRVDFEYSSPPFLYQYLFLCALPCEPLVARLYNIKVPLAAKCISVCFPG